MQVHMYVSQYLWTRQITERRIASAAATGVREVSVVEAGGGERGKRKKTSHQPPYCCCAYLARVEASVHEYRGEVGVVYSVHQRRALADRVGGGGVPVESARGQLYKQTDAGGEEEPKVNKLYRDTATNWSESRASQSSRI